MARISQSSHHTRRRRGSEAGHARHRRGGVRVASGLAGARVARCPQHAL